MCTLRKKTSLLSFPLSSTNMYVCMLTNTPLSLLTLFCACGEGIPMGPHTRESLPCQGKKGYIDSHHNTPGVSVNLHLQLFCGKTLEKYDYFFIQTGWLPIQVWLLLYVQVGPSLLYL